MRGPVEPALTSPAVDRPRIIWLRIREEEKAKIPRVEPQTIGSTLGASRRWSNILAKSILVEVWCNAVEIGAYPLDVILLLTRFGERT
jgi:hypothetical protein